MESRRQFFKYPNKVLVETGSFHGEGIEEALLAKFEKIISFEIVPALHQECLVKFKGNEKVQLILGSSANLLLETIKSIETPITFWLDGHFCFGPSSYDPDFICPLLQELEQIKQHPIKNHTILIDDRRLFVRTPAKGLDDGMLDVSEAEVIEKLKSINPDYNIKYENGIQPGDIIAAFV